MRTQRPSVLLVVVFAVLVVQATMAQTAHWISIDTGLEFLGANGEPVAVPAGYYEVECRSPNELDLTLLDSSDKLTLSAATQSHGQELEAPVASLVVTGDGQFHVLLFLPGGQLLEATGHEKGVAVRGRRPSLATVIGTVFESECPPTGTIGSYSRRNFEYQLAYNWAPIHYQDVAVEGAHSINGKADYITAVDYDNDWNTANNWDHLEGNYPLKAVVYYSVVETTTHWFIIYAFYHPRDWMSTGLAADTEHENDMEGFLAIVRKTDQRFGRLDAVVTHAHTDFYSYPPAGSPLKKGDEGLDGTLLMADYDGSYRPVTAQEAKGHGVKAYPHYEIRGGDGLIYFPSKAESETPDGPNDRCVRYRLESIAPGRLWDHRAASMTFAKWGRFAGDTSGSCGGGSKDCKTHSARAPWRWDDVAGALGDLTGPADQVPEGWIATDPAYLTRSYFRNLGGFDRYYLSNPYRSFLRIPDPELLRWNTLASAPAGVPGAPPRWTTTAFYRSRGNTYLFALEKRSGIAHVYRMNTDGTLGPRIRRYDWTSGWTLASPYAVGGRQFIMIMKYGKLFDGWPPKPGHGDVSINPVQSDGTVGKSIYRDKKAKPGWTRAVFYEAAGKTYHLRLSSTTGDMEIYKMTTDGTPGPRVKQYSWRRGWTIATPGTLLGSPFLFFLRSDPDLPVAQGNLYRVKPDGTLGEKVDSRTYVSGAEDAKFYEFDGRHYLAILFSNGSLLTYLVNPDGKMRGLVESHRWGKAWQDIEFYRVGNKQFMFNLGESGMAQILRKQ